MPSLRCCRLLWLIAPAPWCTLDTTRALGGASHVSQQADAHTPRSCTGALVKHVLSAVPAASPGCAPQFVMPDAAPALVHIAAGGAAPPGGPG